MVQVSLSLCHVLPLGNAFCLLCVQNTKFNVCHPTLLLIDATITKDIRQYLSTRFSKGSVDSEMQHQIRENLHTRSIPC